MSKIITVDVRMLRSSGIGTVIQNILKRAIAQRQDWCFRVLGDPAMIGEFSWSHAQNVEVHAFTQPILSISEQIHWPIELARGSDLLVCPNYNIPLRWNGPLLTFVQDVAHLALKDIFGPLQRLYARIMFGSVRRKSTAITFISRFTELEFEHYVGKPRRLSSVVHLGVDDVWFEAALPESAERQRHIIFVGNIKPNKNLLRLLAAFEKVRDAIPQDLLLVGRKYKGDEAVTAMVERSGGRVRFTGLVSDAELYKLVASADILVLPSFYEGFGLPPLEAMAACTATLVSSAASLPEVCGDASIYCDPMDVDDIAAGLLRLGNDAELRQRLRRDGLAHARKFSWDTTATKFIAAVEQAIARGQ